MLSSGNSISGDIQRSSKDVYFPIFLNRLGGAEMTKRILLSSVSVLALYASSTIIAAIPAQAQTRPAVTDSWAGLYLGAAYRAGTGPARTSFSDSRRRRSGRPFRERR